MSELGTTKSLSSIEPTQQPDLLNQARIQSSQQISQLFSTEKKTNSLKKMITDDNQYCFRSRINNLLQSTLSEQIFITPIKQPNRDMTQTIEIHNKTKTINIKAKNRSGKLYKEICPICLVQYDQIRGNLSCKHIFCFNCIYQWSKTSTACPCCRVPFSSIVKVKLLNIIQNSNEKQRIMDKIIEEVSVEEKKMEFHEEDYYVCYHCGLGDNQHVLLICDQCDFYSCHIYCDPTLNNQIPEGQWYCKFCHERMRAEQPEQQNQLSMSTISDKDKFQQDDNQQIFDNERPIAARTRSRNNFSNVRVLRRLRRIH